MEAKFEMQNEDKNGRILILSSERHHDDDMGTMPLTQAFILSFPCVD